MDNNYYFKGYGKKLIFEELKNPLKLKKKISIIIPTYNEEENIRKIILKIRNVMRNTLFKDNYEIVVVDDNSKDKTPEIIDYLSKDYGVIALHRYGFKGLYSAVIDGIKISNGEYVLIMDADFSHPPEMIPDFLKYMNDYDIIVGSRFVKGGGNEEPFVRKIGTFFLNKICSLILGSGVMDLGGQFRLLNKGKFLRIKLKHEVKFAEYGMEIFYESKKLGYKILEIPFVYKFREEGESKMGSTFELFPLGFHYLKRAIQLRFGK